MELKKLQDLLETATKLFNLKQNGHFDNEIQARMLDVKGRLITLIRKYPGGSLTAAMVLGFVIGKIMKHDD